MGDVGFRPTAPASPLTLILKDHFRLIVDDCGAARLYNVGLARAQLRMVVSGLMITQ